MTENEEMVGVFLGLKSSSYEYIADILAPYKANFSLEIGDVLLIGDESEKIVARVTQYAPEGELTSFMGLKWLGDVALEQNAIGSEIKSKKVRYRVQIKILGALNKDKDFIPGVRRIPNITSKVIKPDTKTVGSIINQALTEEKNGIELGEYYLDKSIKVKFDMSSLHSKRTFIFARAGYGKSNLMKVIAHNWKPDYGGLLIFDAEGEYAVTDNVGRPGIMDGREALLISNRTNLPAGLKNVHSNMRIDLSSLPPKFVVPILVPEEKHETIFFSKLMSLNKEKWKELVHLLDENGWATTDSEIKKIVSGSEDKDHLNPIRNNLIPAIQAMHDPGSNLLEIIENALEGGVVIIMDISLLDGLNAQRLSALVIKQIFDRNQRFFTGSNPKAMIKATFVIEEAQTVIGENSSISSFVDLAKEGRKYGLGGVFITQQPKSIPFEILSQADNFFTLHLLSKGDLIALQNANAHYSDDIITQILSEPIKGKAYMWTSSQPFVIPIQILDFERITHANKSVETQKQSKLLDNIYKSISNGDTVFESIYEKLKVVEATVEDPHDRPKELFKRLNETEKDFLDKRGFLQKNNNGTAWAVTFSGYEKIKSHSTKSLLDETA